jgi:hypothetical protein
MARLGALARTAMARLGALARTAMARLGADGSVGVLRALARVCIVGSRAACSRASRVTGLCSRACYALEPAMLSSLLCSPACYALQPGSSRPRLAHIESLVCSVRLGDGAHGAPARDAPAHQLHQHMGRTRCTSTSCLLGNKASLCVRVGRPVCSS